MRFRKRLSAAILAIVMMVTSIQAPGVTSYAAEIADGSIENVQDASILDVEETEDAQTAESETQPDEGGVTDDGSQTDDDHTASDDGSLVSDDNLEGDDSQSGDNNPEGGDSQPSDNNSESGDNQPSDDNSEDNASQTDNENDPEEETDAGQISGDDLEKEALSVETEETEVVEAEIDGAYQFGEAPAAEDGISLLSVSEYDNSVEEYLHQQILKRGESIDVSEYSVTRSNVGDLMNGVLNEYPDLYFVNKKFSYQCRESSNKVLSLILTYSTDYDDAAFKENTDAALACVTDGMSDFEKTAALHDYLVVNVEYDNDNYEANTVPEKSHNAYGALVDGISVCQGYALAYKYLLGQVGIESYMVTSTGMNHAWNMVKLDGKYYHVDVTWDDPVPDRVGKVRHTHMFCSDTSITQLDHSGWTVTYGSSVVDYIADDSTYDSAFWKSISSPLVFNGNDCYYVSYDLSVGGRIMKADFSNITDEGTQVVAIGQWDYNGSPFSEAYSGLYMINNRLFYNDMTSICSVKLDGTGKRTEFTADTTGGRSIYGSAYRKGTVYYAMYTFPNVFEKETVLVAEINEEFDEPDPPEETKEGYNVDNLADDWLAEFGFKNVLDSNGKTTPKAEGNPVVLMFYNSSNSNIIAQMRIVNTLKAIGEHAGYFKTDADHVDFYGVEKDFNGTEESIKNFIESNDIPKTDVFNWIYTLRPQPYQNEVLSQIGDKVSITGTDPIMIYIDKNNKIQYVTEGYLTAEDILVNLRQYCGYTQYRITYEMAGGTNNSGNPDMYTGGEEVILKNPPYRNGYCFNGWYKDEQYTQKVTRIPAGSKNDVTLYAKWTEGAYNLANLTQEYTTLDDTKVTSAADGKPKLLMFFDINEDTGNFEDMTEALEDANHDLHGIDIYAIETSKATKSALENYSKAYSEDIIFCYDTSGVNEQYMYDYAKASGFDMEFPESIFKCYIDKDNRLQYVNYYMCILEVIMEHLQEYCNYPSSSAAYKIQYELNGGINDSSNPDSYHSGMETITLKAPTKEGYRFGGWYADAEFKEIVTEIPKGSTGDIILYAKWSNGLNADNLEYEFNTVDGGTVSSAADGKPKILLFFSGSEVPSQRVHNELSEHIKAFSGIDIYSIAVVEGKEKVIAFKEQYGCDDITYCYDTRYQNVTRMVRYVNFVDPSATNSTVPVIVYIDAENRVQQVVTESRSWTGIFDDLREYCDYNGYWIDYELYGGKNDSENPYIYTEDTDTIILKDPVNGTSKFDGWFEDAEYTKPVNEIPKGSKGDITLYAKWTKVGEGLGLDNLNKTFTALDDTTFGSAAENGRPRILIFFKHDCPRSLATLKSVSDAKQDFEGVDIYEIESQYQDKNMVSSQIQEYYGFEESTVSYDTDSGNYNAMLEYLQAGQITGQIEFPVVCYINAENYLEWVTMAQTATADIIQTNLKKYCNYPPEPEGLYHITYELDGGTNHKDNPDTYTSETETIILKDPSKARFIFEGWYKDAEFNEKVEDIAKGSTGDITLYAKWSANEDGRLGVDNLDQTYKGLDGKALSSGADGKPKLLVFFTTGSTKSQNTFGNIKEVIGSLDGVDIYAIETSQAYSSAVTVFKNTYGCDEITFAYDDWSSPSNYDKAAAYEAIAGLSGMYSPLICYIDKDNKLQWVTENEQTGEAVLENLKKYCDYPSQGTYKIIYELYGGENNEENPETYTSETETIKLADPVKKGYTFDGWYKDAEFKENVIEIVKGSTGDITLYAKWKEKGPDLGNPSVEFTTVDDKIVSSTADGKPKLILFYGNDDSYSTYTIEEIARGLVMDSKELATVDIYAVEVNQGTKDSVLEVKSNHGWSLDSITYSYDTGDSNKNSMLEYAKAAELDSVDKLPMLCYIDAANRLRYVSLGASTVDDIASNINKYCDSSGLEPEIYNITYELEGGTNDPENPLTYTSETDTIVLKEASKEGFIFEGWYKDAECKEVVTEIVKGSTGDIILYAKWKAASEETVSYKITYELNGGVNDKENPETYTSETETIVLKDASRDGFIFDGWYKDAEFKESVTEIVKGSTGDITLYAKWNAELVSYKITYELDGGVNDKENPETYTYDTETIVLKDAYKADFVFDGWYKDAGFKEAVTEIAKGSIGDITLYARWREAEISISVNLPKTTYKVGQELDITDGKVVLTKKSDNNSKEEKDMKLDMLKGFDSSKPGICMVMVICDGYTGSFETLIVEEPKLSAKYGQTLGDVVLPASEYGTYAWADGTALDKMFDKAGEYTYEAVFTPKDTEKFQKLTDLKIQVTVTGKTGISVQFTDNDGLKDSTPVYKYTGAAVKPDVEVYNNDTLLTLGTDYTISYKNNIKVGSAGLIVKGKGNFSGASNAVSFEIIRADIDTDTDHPTEMTVIAGTKVAPVIMNGAKNLTVKDYKLEGRGLENGKYAEATAAESFNTLTVNGIGSYEGSFTIQVKVIDRNDAKKLAVTVDKNFKPEYNGNALDLDSLFASPSNDNGKITVTDSTDKTQVLKKGKDFTVVCASSLKDAGTVKFTVTGMGLYAGSVSKSFKINPLKDTDGSKFEVRFDDKVYEYKAAGTAVDNLEVRYTGSEYGNIVLVPGRDYKVSYSNNKSVSAAKKAQVKITFLGNYKGSKPISKNFTIAAAKLSSDGADANTAVVIPDKVYSKAGKAYKSVPIVTVDGAAIKATNYTVSYAWITETEEKNAGEYLSDNKVKVTLENSDNYAKVKVTITLKGSSYEPAGEGTVIEGEYYVRRAGDAVDLSKAKVTFLNKDGNTLKALEYTGRAYYTPEGNNPEDANAPDDPNAVYVKVTVNGDTVSREQYDIVWTNADAKGKAVVVINGKGASAVGGKSQAVSIKAMALKGRNLKTFMENAAYSLKNMFF